MQMSRSDKMEQFFENIYKLAEHYINIVEYDNQRKIASVDMASAKICAQAAERMLDAIDENSNSPLINLIWQILYDYSVGFDFLCEKGPFLSGYDYVSYYLYLARSTSTIMFALTNWIEDPKKGNGYSLLKLVPAARSSGDIFYYDHIDKFGITAHFAPFIPLYCLAQHGKATFQFSDYNGFHKTIVDLKNIEAPFDTKSIFFDDRSKKYLLE